MNEKLIRFNDNNDTSGKLNGLGLIFCVYYFRIEINHVESELSQHYFAQSIIKKNNNVTKSK